ncbi:MAG: hypothetical protein ABIB46_01505 [bacterium]
MAIALMKKINIFAHISLQDKIVNTLQDLELVQIIDINPISSMSVSECDEIKSLKNNLKQIEESIKFISTFETKQIKEKPILEEEEFEETGKKYDFLPIKQKIDNFSEKIDFLEKKESSLNIIHQFLIPWKNLSYSLDSLEKIKNSTNMQFFLGKLSIQNKDEVVR